MTTDARTPAFLFRSETARLSSDRSPFLVLTAHAVYLTAAGEVRNYLDGPDDALAGLQVNASYDRTLTVGGYYGQEVHYRDIYSVNLRRAEAMLRTLRKVDRGMDRLRAKFGDVESFASFVGYAADTLGVKSYGWRREASSSGMYDDSTYHWTDLQGFGYHVAGVVAAFDKSAAGAPA